jgi:ABC-type branched-subunit amino acid transport system ATPase component
MPLRTGRIVQKCGLQSIKTLDPVPQNMHFCLGLASHATVIDKGQIVYTATIDDLKANDNIRQRYLAL